MMRGKHLRAARRIGPFRAINAVNNAVYACAGMGPSTFMWEMLPWKQDTAERVLVVCIQHQIGYYCGEDHIHQVVRLALLTAYELLGRMLHADGTLSWRAVSVAIAAVKKVFAAYYAHKEDA